MRGNPHEQNRLSWNEATRRHNLHKGDQVQFFRDGGTTLYPEEVELLGDLSGKSLLHLQCNAGQDSLSIARHLGAQVTGVDISDEAIATARRLSTESGIPARFERGDVIDWCREAEGESFDVVFVSYGALTWLSDLKAWAKGIHRMLKPGGRLVVMEFHPLLMMFAEEGGWDLKYDYMGGEEIWEEEGVGDYVGESEGRFCMGNEEGDHLPEFVNPQPAVAFAWGLAEVVAAVLDAGLNLKSLTEYPFSNGWKPYPDMIAQPDGRIVLAEGMPKLALMFSLVAART